MTMAETGPPFTVSYPDSVRAALRELAERAAGLWLLDNVLAAARAIGARLKQDPRSFGEPKYRYQHANLVLHVAIHPPLVVHFTVHDDLSVVFVKSLSALPGHGF